MPLSRRPQALMSGAATCKASQAMQTKLHQLKILKTEEIEEISSHTWCLLPTGLLSSGRSMGAADDHACHAVVFSLSCHEFYHLSLPITA